MIRLIGIAGSAGSGKDLATDIICRLFGATNISTGDLIRSITRHIYDLPSDFNPVRDQLFEVATFLREINPATTIQLSIYKAQAQNVKVAILSGLRSVGEADAIRQAGGIIVGVDADPDNDPTYPEIAAHRGRRKPGALQAVPVNTTAGHGEGAQPFHRRHARQGRERPLRRRLQPDRRDVGRAEAVPNDRGRPSADARRVLGDQPDPGGAAPDVGEHVDRGRKVDLVIPGIPLILLRAPCPLDHCSPFCNYNNVVTNLSGARAF